MDKQLKELMARIMDGSLQLVGRDFYQPYSELVNAFQIQRITLGPKEAILVSGEGSTLISREAHDRHKPEPGWYFVIHADESVSLLPPDKFHARFRAIKNPRV